MADCYHTFNAYVADHPEGENFRRWLTNDGRREPIIMKCDDPHHTTIPGGYLWAIVIHHPAREGKPPTKNRKAVKAVQEHWRIWVNDVDDGYVVKEFPTEGEAVKEMNELGEMAPLNFGDLIKFGFHHE